MLFGDVNVGDKIVIWLTKHPDDCCNSTVEKVTPTAFYSKMYAFRRSDGAMVGGKHYHDRIRALPANHPEAIAAIDRMKKKDRMNKAYAALNMASPEVLEQVFSLLGV